jgi:hypothetical protein
MSKMTYNQTMTQLRRQNQYATSDFALLSQLASDFSGEDGPAELADVLGVSLLEASAVRAGKAPPDMNRLAYHYGFRPDGAANGWRVLPMDDEPFGAGPPHRWDARLIEYLRQVLSNPAGAPSVRDLAWRLDTTESRLRDALRRRGIHLSPDRLPVAAAVMAGSP